MNEITLEQRQAWAAKSRATRTANNLRREQEAREIRERGILQRDGLLHQIELLSAQLDNMVCELERVDRMKAFSVIPSRLDMGRLLCAPEVVAASKPWARPCGVYFLIDRGVIVYVGQSVNVYSRIAQHETWLAFDSFAYVECSREHLNILESLYIHLLRPERNGTDGFMNAPLPLRMVLDEIARHNHAAP